MLQGHVQPVGAVLGPVDFVPGLGQTFLQVLAGLGVVFDKQNVHRRSGSLHVIGGVAGAGVGWIIRLGQNRREGLQAAPDVKCNQRMASGRLHFCH